MNATQLNLPTDADGNFIDEIPRCGYRNVDGTIVASESARELCYGAEYYGTFTRAWFSLFQVLTGESWAEGVARPILFGWDEYGKGFSAFLSAFFFISFMLINSFILFNVFVAVLLDKVTAADEEKDEEDEAVADAAKPADAAAGAPAGAFREGSVGAALAAAAKPKSSAKLLEALIKGVAEEQRAQREEMAEMREMMRLTLQR